MRLITSNADASTGRAVHHSETLNYRPSEKDCCDRVWENYDDSTEKQKVIFYGNKNRNDHPEKLRQIQEQSLMHSGIVRTAGALIAGKIQHKIKGHEGELSNDQKAQIKEIEQKYKDWNITKTHGDRGHQIYAYGGAPVLLDFALKDGKRHFKIAQRDFVDFRLGCAVNTFHGLKSKFHYYHHFWSKVSSSGLNGQSIKNPKAFFNSQKVRENWILRVEALDENTSIGDMQKRIVSYLIAMPKRTNKHYPKPIFESEVFWENVRSECELAKLMRGSIKRGLRSDYMINVYRSVYTQPENDEHRADTMHQDKKYIEDNYLGFDNAGTVKINYIGLKNGSMDDKFIQDGYIEVVPIPSNNNFKETKSRKDSIHSDMRAAHSFGVPQLAGQSDSTGGFSNLAEYLLYGTEMYINSVIRPHSEKIQEFYNWINRLNGYENIETIVEPTVPIMKALVKEFRDCLTEDECRQKIFGLGPKVDDDKINEIAEKVVKRLKLNKAV